LSTYLLEPSQISSLLKQYAVAVVDGERRMSSNLLFKSDCSSTLVI